MNAFAYLNPEQVEVAKQAYIDGKANQFLNNIEEELDIEVAESGADRDHTSSELEELREKRLYEIFEL